MVHTDGPESKVQQQVDNRDQPLVSIIINNFNYARFVGAAIDSALGQSYPNVEVIVVDDGSIDDSRSVIDSYGSKIVKIYKSNGGQGSAYNSGFSASRGKLIHFLDSDDLLCPDAMRKVVDSWTENVSKVHFRLLLLEGDGSVPTEVLVPAADLSNGDVRSMLLTTGTYSTPASSGNTYSRAALSKILPLPESEWRTAADLYCIFQCAFLGDVLAIEAPLGLYRLHGANMDAQSTITGELVRYRLSLENRRDKLLIECAARHGFAYKAGTVSNDFGNMKLRLASILLDPESHPYAEDTITLLLKRCLRNVFQNEAFSLRKRLFTCAWLFAVTFVPRRWIQPVLIQGFNPTRRPTAVRSLLRPKVPSLGGQNSWAAHPQDPSAITEGVRRL